MTRRGHKQNKASTGVIINRRASYDYSLSDSLTVGLSLTGLEVKAARLNRVSLKGAYVVPKRGPRGDESVSYTHLTLPTTERV